MSDHLSFVLFRDEISILIEVFMTHHIESPIEKNVTSVEMSL